jgi:hypothetical protein
MISSYQKNGCKFSFSSKIIEHDDACFTTQLYFSLHKIREPILFVLFIKVANSSGDNSDEEAKALKRGDWKWAVGAALTVVLVGLTGLSYWRRSSVHPMVKSGDDLIKAVFKGTKSQDLQLFDEFGEGAQQ